MKTTQYETKDFQQLHKYFYIWCLVSRKREIQEQEKVSEIIAIFSKHHEQETLSPKIIEVFFSTLMNSTKISDTGNNGLP